MVERLSAALVLLAAITGSGGSTAPTPRDEGKCLVLCEQEISELGQQTCLGRELEAAEKELEVAIATLRQGVSGRQESREALAAFEAAQVAWVSYRAAQCQAVAANWSGGSGQRGAKLFCLVEHTRLRTFELWRDSHLESLPAPRVVCAESGPDS